MTDLSVYCVREFVLDFQKKEESMIPLNLRTWVQRLSGTINKVALAGNCRLFTCESFTQRNCLPVIV